MPLQGKCFFFTRVILCSLQDGMGDRQGNKCQRLSCLVYINPLYYKREGVLCLFVLFHDKTEQLIDVIFCTAIDRPESGKWENISDPRERCFFHKQLPVRCQGGLLYVLIQIGIIVKDVELIKSLIITLTKRISSGLWIYLQNKIKFRKLYIRHTLASPFLFEPALHRNRIDVTRKLFSSIRKIISDFQGVQGSNSQRKFQSQS